MVYLAKLVTLSNPSTRPPPLDTMHLAGIMAIEPRDAKLINWGWSTIGDRNPRSPAGKVTARC